MVSTVATIHSMGNFLNSFNVSIPQAVNTIATRLKSSTHTLGFSQRFNTVNGRYCCNLKFGLKFVLRCLDGFNTVNGRYCCNLIQALRNRNLFNVSFNTVNGRYCCNPLVFVKREFSGMVWFQYRKR